MSDPVQIWSSGGVERMVAYPREDGVWLQREYKMDKRNKHWRGDPEAQILLTWGQFDELVMRRDEIRRGGMRYPEPKDGP